MLDDDQTHGKQAAENTSQNTRRNRRRDQYFHYSHEMPHDTKEASGRVIIRVVPLLYSGMIGGVFDHVIIALSIGALVSVALDLTMGDKSMFRPIFERITQCGCPVFAAASRGLAKCLTATGVQPPAQLRDARCRAT